MAVLMLPIKSRMNTRNAVLEPVCIPIRARRCAVGSDSSCLRFSDLYDVDYACQLGAGACGGVYLARTRNQQLASRRAQRFVPLTVAVKIIPIHDTATRHSAKQEAAAMRAVNGHEGICSMVDFFEEELHVYIVLEHIVGHSLFDKITQCGSPDMRSVASIFGQVVNALAHCHAPERSVVHGDVKPENIMLEFGGEETEPTTKLIDFGSSYTGPCIAPDMCVGCARNMYGTTAYSAPEARTNGTRSPATDVWSAGIVLYVLLVGSLPSERLQAGLSPCEGLPAEVIKHIDAGARDLIVSLLQVAPERRPTAAQAASHPWVVNAVFQPLRACCFDIDCDTSTCASSPRGSLESCEYSLDFKDIKFQEHEGC
eukprot:TRINITY_DN27288_c0_g1_i1.p1 TRINITY_DN27288_c0_g1~~TRINITY_DN27288_c0_g1_i1.p1  ORF type:complete len:370 (-),score=21.79 TRINITY_DN27288_c0_g1_i1:579-1688(-)